MLARVLRQFGAVIQFLRETIIHIKCASVGSFSPACRRAFLLIKTVCKIKFHQSDQICRNLFKGGATKILNPNWAKNLGVCFYYYKEILLVKVHIF